MVDKSTNFGLELEIVSLFRSNYLQKYHVREMAGLLNKSHVTLLPHLKTLEKNNILQSKFVGRNKQYSLNLENIITKNYMVLSEIVISNSFFNEVFLFKKIQSEIFNLNLSGTIILFGSYAKKTFDKKSDIDIFYIGNMNENDLKKVKDIGKIYAKEINVKKSTLSNFEIGLRKKDPLIIEVIKNHVILQNQQLFINSLWRFYHERS